MGNGSKFSFIQHILRHVLTLLDVLIRNQGFFYIMYRFQLSQTIINLFFQGSVAVISNQISMHVHVFLYTWRHKTCTIGRCPKVLKCTRQGNARMQSKAVHKNNSVSGRGAGWLKKVRLETFFFHFCKKHFFFLKMDNIFLPTKKKVGKKKKLRPPDWLQF